MYSEVSLEFTLWLRYFRCVVQKSTLCRYYALGSDDELSMECILEILVFSEVSLEFVV